MNLLGIWLSICHLESPGFLLVLSSVALGFKPLWKNRRSTAHIWSGVNLKAGKNPRCVQKQDRHHRKEIGGQGKYSLLQQRGLPLFPCRCMSTLRKAFGKLVPRVDGMTTQARLAYEAPPFLAPSPLAKRHNYPRFLQPLLQ